MKILFLVFCLTSTFISGQNNIEPIAKIGTKVITQEEFKQRFELVPRINTKKNNMGLTEKEESLYSLVAEKLWALYALNSGLDSMAAISRNFVSLEKMLVKDALYRYEITRKINISNQELVEATKRIKQKFIVKYLLSVKEAEANTIYSKLINGAAFDSILAGREENELQKDLLSISFGESDENIEREVFKLSIGEFTKPIYSQGAWFIFKLISIDNKNYSDDSELKKDLSKVREILEKRKTNSIEKVYLKSIFAGKKINTNGYLFYAFSDAVIKVLNENKLVNKIPDGEKVALEEKDFFKLSKMIGNDSLNMNFIELDNGPITLQEFLRGFIFEGFFTNNLNPNVVRKKLNLRVKRFIESEILANEAYRRGFDEIPQVKQSINIWKDYYLANLAKSKFLNNIKVSDQELKNYFNEITNSINHFKKVNVSEIFSSDLEVIETVLNKLNNNYDFRQLSIKYGNNKNLKMEGGESGFISLDKLGELKPTVEKMNVGDIAGPVSIGNGYSIIKLLDIKESSNDMPENYDELKDEYEKQLRAQKAEKLLTEKTIELAKKFDVKINNELLRESNFKNKRMLIYRYIGFGGRILAFPFTPQFSNWALPWMSKQKSLP